MNDRELLENAAKAAKAAGIEYVLAENGTFLIAPGLNPLAKVSWNPLTDDGDALRLAVKLRMVISPPDPYLNKVYVSSEHSGAVEDCDDPLAATRRAIVRAAAEIGKGMA